MCLYATDSVQCGRERFKYDLKRLHFAVNLVRRKREHEGQGAAGGSCQKHCPVLSTSSTLANVPSAGVKPVGLYVLGI